MNHRIFIQFWLLSFILLAGFAAKTKAQTFDEARKLAFSGERNKARQLCKAILAKDFDSDVALLLGRTYAWDSKYDSSKVILNEVLKRNSDNMEAIDALADVEYWSGDYDAAIKYCNMALSKDSVNESFLLKKARILHSGEKSGEAIVVLKNLLKHNPANAEAIKKMQEYRLEALKNTIRITYTYDHFDQAFNRDPWQLGAFSYGRKTRYGTVIGRVNLAKRYGDSGLQYEADFWPKLSENNYGYLNYGFSADAVFPQNRFGAEWYHNFPKSFEGSIGLRMLDFESSNVHIYTATLGKYLGNYWFSARSFVTPGSGGTSVSGFLLIRRYFSDAENYLGLRLGYGVSPDDNRNLVDVDSKSRLTLKSRSVKVEFNHIFSRIWILNAGIVYGNEERVQNSFSGYYTFDIGISRLF